MPAGRWSKHDASASVDSGVSSLGLTDDRVARGERRSDLPRQQQQRVVPGHDAADDAHRLLQDERELRRLDRRDHAARRAAADLRVVVERGGDPADLVGVLDQRLAALERHEPGELVGAGAQARRDLVQHLAALDRRRARPGARRVARRGDRGVDLLGGRRGDAREHGFVVGILDVERGAVAGHRLAADQEAGVVVSHAPASYPTRRLAPLDCSRQAGLERRWRLQGARSRKSRPDRMQVGRPAFRMTPGTTPRAAVAGPVDAASLASPIDQGRDGAPAAANYARRRRLQPAEWTVPARTSSLGFAHARGDRCLQRLASSCTSRPWSSASGRPTRWRSRSRLRCRRGRSTCRTCTAWASRSTSGSRRRH